MKCKSTNKSISTWIYENRVSKHFVMSLNFPCLRFFSVVCLCRFLVVLWLRICVEKDISLNRFYYNYVQKGHGFRENLVSVMIVSTFLVC